VETVFQNVSFSYGKRPILKDVSFSLSPGEALAVVGPNGSGKSTLLSLLAGNLKAASGEILRSSHMGYVPQGSALFEDLSVKDNVRFFASLNGVPMPKPLPLDLDTYATLSVSKLSGGTKKRLSIAVATLSSPEFLLLDEPTAALDVRYRDEIIGLVTEEKKAGRTIVYVSHDALEFAPFYDKMLFLSSGGSGRLYTREELGGNLESTFFRLLTGETI